MVRRTLSHLPGAAPATPPQALQAAEAGLGPMLRRARELDRLDHLLRQKLPSVVAANSRLANVDGERLVFLVSAPVWKSKLRVLADVLLDAAAAAGYPARALVVKVVPPVAQMSPDTIGKPLSEAVRESLRAAARSVEDPDLRAQLLKLASVP